MGAVKKGLIRGASAPSAPKWSLTIPKWTEDALCARYYSDGIDFWYAYDYFPALKDEAKEICGRCPVLQQCRDYGDKIESSGTNAEGVLQFPEDKLFGILAGEPPSERRRRRKEQYG